MTHEEMVNSYNNSEEIVGFVGGAKVELSVLDNAVSYQEDKTVREAFFFDEFSDCAIIHFGTVTKWDSNGKALNNITKDQSIFLQQAAEFGIDNCLTKAEMISVLDELMEEDL